MCSRFAACSPTLEPGGLLALDYETEEFDPERWRSTTPRDDYLTRRPVRAL